MVQVADAHLEQLRAFIRECPIIDNHGHNLLLPECRNSSDFLTITTEATGEALKDVPKSLAHIRALKQLRNLYNLPVDSEWECIIKARDQLLADDCEGLVRKCLQGTHMILIDDGLGAQSEMHPYEWHSSFTTSACRRVVRIETVAASTARSLYVSSKLPVGSASTDADACRKAWTNFFAIFEKAILDALRDPEVAGFKSVVCYRTGLDVSVDTSFDANEASFNSFQLEYLPQCVGNDFRVQAKRFNDVLVTKVCYLIATRSRSAKPIQFHTGLGDNDMSLVKSNPAYLQVLIKAYPTVPIILLHSSYPFTREAGYLATVYDNVYLDVGEIFMMLSRNGLDEIVKQALELTPYSKILYSTDGHHHPETYWLANIHGRQAIENVMCEYVVKEDLTMDQAFEAVQAIFFENSNRIYKLGLQLPPSALELRIAASKHDNIQESHAKEMIESGPSGHNVRLRVEVLDSFLDKYSHVQFIFVQWVDFLGQMRSRCLPISEFKGLIKDGRRISISNGNLGTLQNDHMSSVCDPVGSIHVDVDLASLRPMQTLGSVKNAATVMSRLTDTTGSPLDLCPRSALQAALDAAKKQYDIYFLVGFEIEVTFCKLDSCGPTGENTFSAPLDTEHAWGTFSDQQYTEAIPLMMAIVTALQDIAPIQQMHSEAGPGQYEFVLPPLPPVLAVDTLVQVRQAITQIAATNNLRATFHPSPFPGIGTAAHAHVSFNSATKSDEEISKIEMMYMASVLDHLDSICAFTLPQEESYFRVKESSWTGGTWVAWGTENREVPLRRIESGHRWEIRCMDGFPNTYLALLAIFAAGKLGLDKNMEMELKDCLSDPAKLAPAQREELGVVRELPKSLDFAISQLDHDLDLRSDSLMSSAIIDHYSALKKAEQEMLGNMSATARRVWLMKRY